MLEIADWNAYYGTVKVLHDVSLKIEKDEIVTIIGANGAGKTTLLQSVAGLLKTVKGKVIFEGTSIVRHPVSRLVTMGISLVPEGRQLFPSLEVEDNLRLGAYQRRIKKQDFSNELEKVYDFFPRLKERRDQLAGTLSGGEQQMVAIGRALLSAPKLLLLDEPSIGLAPKVVDIIFEVIHRLRKDGVTILLVEQNAMAALEMADRGYILVNGKIAMGDTADNLLENDIVRKSYLGFS